MKYERLTKSKWTNDNCKPVYDKNGNIVMDKELFDLLITEHNRLSEYEDDEESGKIVRLPCKVGNTIWVIYQYGDCFGKVDEPFIEKDTAKFFVYDDNKMKIVPSNYGERSDYWYRVLDIFLTREEAEKKLQELQNG